MPAPTTEKRYRNIGVFPLVDESEWIEAGGEHPRSVPAIQFPVCPRQDGHFCLRLFETRTFHPAGGSAVAKNGRAWQAGGAVFLMVRS